MANTIRVWPANEDIRRVMKHPNGIGFRHSVALSVSWPRDGFTIRRIREGHVLTAPPESTEDAEGAAPKQRKRSSSTE